MYAPSDATCADQRTRAREFMKLYNATETDAQEERASLLRKYLGHVGENCYIEPSFCCDYGCNIYLGDNFYCNFDCLFLDSAPIHIGNNVMLGPGVHIYTPCHPLDAATRNSGMEFTKPVRIGNDVWIGGRAVICPGVTIGNGVVVGAGAVVTKDVADNCVVAGNPAKVIRIIEQ